MTTTPEREVVDRMFLAFQAQDLEGSVATVSDDSIWIHHGSQKLPSLRFEGRAGVRTFFNTNFTSLKVDYFRVLDTIQRDNTVVVFGEERFLMDGQSEHFAQKWIQVYTVEGGLITRMEEFATSALPEQYLVITE